MADIPKKINTTADKATKLKYSRISPPSREKKSPSPSPSPKPKPNKPKPNPRKKPTANEMKADGTRVEMNKYADYQLDRKDNQSIAKMIKKMKNSNCGSPSKALVFQPKNLNQHLDTKPTPKNSTVEEENKDPKNKDGKEVPTDKEVTLNTINDASKSGAAKVDALNNAAPVAMKNPESPEKMKPKKAITGSIPKTGSKGDEYVKEDLQVSKEMRASFKKRHPKANLKSDHQFRQDAINRNEEYRPERQRGKLERKYMKKV